MRKKSAAAVRVAASDLLVGMPILSQRIRGPKGQVKSRAHREALIWLVGPNLDGRRAFHPVRSTDAPDNDEHGGT